MVHEVRVPVPKSNTPVSSPDAPNNESSQKSGERGAIESSTEADATQDSGEMKQPHQPDAEAQTASRANFEIDGKPSAADLSPKKKPSQDIEKNTKSDEEPTKEPQRPPSPRILPGPSTDSDTIDFPLSSISNHLICPLCQGYFRDPYTVADCLHSFCRSCLILHFRVGHRRCPTCNISLEPDPFREVLADRTLQEIVDKIFPWMRKKEDEEEKAFYAARGIKLKPEYETVEAPPAKKQKAVEGSKKTGKDASLAKKGMANDMLDLQLEPAQNETSLPPLRCPLLRTSGRLKVVSIKKYLIQRLGLKDIKQSSIEILCNGDIVGNEHSLTFILRTRWFSPSKILTLNYSFVEGSSVASLVG